MSLALAVRCIARPDQFTRRIKIRLPNAGVALQGIPQNFRLRTNDPQTAPVTIHHRIDDLRLAFH